MNHRAGLLPTLSRLFTGNMSFLELSDYFTGIHRLAEKLRIRFG
jgi:hypothetical protein